MFQLSRDQQQVIVEVLEDNGCHQLASGLRQEGGIGQQVIPSGSLNGLHIENHYVQVVGNLAVSGLAGRGYEVACRSVDAACFQVGIQLDVSERDTFAHLLNKGEIVVVR